MDVAIRTESLTKHYGPTVGVDQLDLEVRAGEVFGFLGPNGAGKTTTIRLLLDLIRPTAGRAEVLGLDAHAASTAIRARTGYLPGDLALPERLTAGEALAYLARLRGGVPSGRIDTLAELLGLELDRPIRTLSKGNRQKVGVVQACMHDPELLVLDEPTSGLDPLVQQDVHRLLREAVAEGRTVFLSSHVLDEVQRVADRVGILRSGTLVVTEDVDDLRAKALRRIELSFARFVPASAFAGLPGVRSAIVDGGRLHLEVEGALDAVVKEAARHEVVDLLSEEPDLEEIFLTYYRSAA